MKNLFVIGLMVLSVVALACGIITFKIDVEDEEIKPFTILMLLVSLVSAISFVCYL